MLTSRRVAVAAFGFTVHILCLLLADRLRIQCSSGFAGGMLFFAALAIIGSEYAANLRRVFRQSRGCRLEDGKSQASAGRFPPSTISFPLLRERGVDDRGDDFCAGPAGCSPRTDACGKALSRHVRRKKAFFTLSAGSDFSTEFSGKSDPAAKQEKFFLRNEKHLSKLFTFFQLSIASQIPHCK